MGSPPSPLTCDVLSGWPPMVNCTMTYLDWQWKVTKKESSLRYTFLLYLFLLLSCDFLWMKTRKFRRSMETVSLQRTLRKSLKCPSADAKLLILVEYIPSRSWQSLSLPVQFWHTTLHDCGKYTPKLRYQLTDQCTKGNFWISCLFENCTLRNNPRLSCICQVWMQPVF